MAERQLTVEEADEVIHQLFETSSDEDDFEGFENVNVDSNESDSDSGSEDKVPQAQAQEWAEVAVGLDRTDTRWLPDLVEKEPGPTFQTDDPATCTPVDTFQEFFSDTVVHNVVVETNRYAHQRLERLGDRYPQARIRQWQDVTRDEIFVLVLMILAMGTVQQPEMTNHWSEAAGDTRIHEGDEPQSLPVAGIVPAFHQQQLRRARPKRRVQRQAVQD